MMMGAEPDITVAVDLGTTFTGKPARGATRPHKFRLLTLFFRSCMDDPADACPGHQRLAGER